MIWSPSDCAAWLGLLSESLFLNPSVTSELLPHWQSTGIELIDVKARVITAENFNTSCQAGSNKANLLSESTLGLVGRLIDLHGKDEAKVTVFCDRHGGRKFYGGVLQHVFPDARLQVTCEEKHQSEYGLTQAEQQIDAHFTVKGDSFTPVALSSMHAKYLRERFMQSLNQYFALRHNADSKCAHGGLPRRRGPILGRRRVDARARRNRRAKAGAVSMK